MNLVLDDSGVDLSEELPPVTDCGTPVDQKHKAKDQLSMFYMSLKIVMCFVYHVYKRDKDIRA